MVPGENHDGHEDSRSKHDGFWEPQSLSRLRGVLAHAGLPEWGRSQRDTEMHTEKHGGKSYQQCGAPPHTPAGGRSPCPPARLRRANSTTAPYPSPVRARPSGRSGPSCPTLAVLSRSGSLAVEGLPFGLHGALCDFPRTLLDAAPLSPTKLPNRQSANHAFAGRHALRGRRRRGRRRW